jgi:hypothetical protein
MPTTIPEDLNKEFKGNGLKYIEDLDNRDSSFKEMDYDEKVYFVILGLLHAGLDIQSIEAQLQDIKGIDDYVKKIEIVLYKQLAGGL